MMLRNPRLFSSMEVVMKGETISINWVLIEQRKNGLVLRQAISGDLAMVNQEFKSIPLIVTVTGDGILQKVTDYNRTLPIDELNFFIQSKSFDDVQLIIAVRRSKLNSILDSIHASGFMIGCVSLGCINLDVFTKVDSILKVPFSSGTMSFMDNVSISSDIVSDRITIKSEVIGADHTIAYAGILSFALKQIKGIPELMMEDQLDYYYKVHSLIDMSKKVFAASLLIISILSGVQYLLKKELDHARSIATEHSRQSFIRTEEINRSENIRYLNDSLHMDDDSQIAAAIVKSANILPVDLVCNKITACQQDEIRITYNGNTYGTHGLTQFAERVNASEEFSEPSIDEFNTVDDGVQIFRISFSYP